MAPAMNLMANRNIVGGQVSGLEAWRGPGSEDSLLFILI
jgi:hypothetical protein